MPIGTLITCLIMHFKKLLLINKKEEYYNRTKESKEATYKYTNNDIKLDHIVPRTIIDSDNIIFTKSLDLTTVKCSDSKERNSDYYSTEESYFHSSVDRQIVHTSIPLLNSHYLPFGDGSNKVFGYENFGNTCYCNSILQCLFYLDSFRVIILSFPLHLTNGFIRDSSTLTNNHNNRNNNGSVNTLRRHRKRSMDGRKKRYFTMESFQTIVKERKKCQNDKQVNCVESDDSTNVNKEKPIMNNIIDNIVDQNQTKSSSFSFFSKHKKNKSLSPEIYNSKGPNNKSDVKDLSANIYADDIGPAHSTVMKADYATEKLHEGCQRIIVGRSNCFPITSTESSLIVTSSISTIRSESQLLMPSSKLSDTNIEKLLNSDQTTLLKDNNGIRNSNFSINTFTSEKRKKSALIHGPIINIDYMVNVSAKPNIYNGLKDIFECITENDRLTGIVSPLQFMQILKKENILFRTSSQQDAHELLSFILNSIDDYLKTVNHEGGSNYVPANFINFIEDQFKGFMKSTIKCLTCDTKTSNIESFLDFPIELINEDENINIQELFNDYKQSEFLKGSNKFYCNQCNSLQEAERSVTIDMLPHILILHLKRFEYSEELGTNVKLFNKIVYPLILDVSSSMNCSNKVYKRYELTSVVVHMGVSSRHGHYISICKSSQYGWLLFDDETVESVGESTVLKFIGDKNDQTTAYVLFYKEVFGNNFHYNGKCEIRDKSSSEVEEIVSVSDIKPQNKDEYEKRIENLIKKDDHIRELEEKKLQRLNKEHEYSEINDIAVHNIFSHISERDSNFIVPFNDNKPDDDKSTHKTNKRKSLLGSFMMK